MSSPLQPQPDTGRDIGNDSSLDLSALQLVCGNLCKEEANQTTAEKFQKEDKEEEILKEAEHQKDSALESNTSDKDKESDTEQEQVATGDEEKSGEQNATRVPRNGDDVSDGKATQKDRLGEQKKMKPWLMNSVRVLLEHLNKFGVCVVDDFLGEERGNQVLQEVQALQENDCFQDGQVMSGGGLYEPSIRSDKITWTDGVTPVNAPALRHLIQLLDSIVMTANRVPNNGELGKYRINGRTKAMVACYPGGGSHYVRHVDNPNRDGRVVTAIYYLNKDWNSQYDGGSLKIYTQVNNGAVAKVDPLFDRIAFFWSDSRNPHEVVPSNKNRLAVTVWYLDETEKRVYERRKQEAAAAAALQNIHNPR